MKKKIILLLVGILLITSRGIVEAGAEKTLRAIPTKQNISLDGKLRDPRAYNIGGNNYFMLRDVAHILKDTKSEFQIEWNGEKKAINLRTSSIYTREGPGSQISTPYIEEKARKSTAKLYKDGEEVFLMAYLIGGHNYYKLRDLADELGFKVAWDFSSNTVLMLSDPKMANLESKDPVIVKTNVKESDSYINAQGIKLDKNNYREWTKGEKQDQRELILEMINEERKSLGREPLELDETLNHISQYKAEDMYKENKLAHTGCYGTLRDLYNKFNLNYRAAAENCSYGYRTGEEIYKSFYNSPGHYGNMVDPNLRKIGIGFKDTDNPIREVKYSKIPRGYKGDIYKNSKNNDYILLARGYWCAMNFSD